MHTARGGLHFFFLLHAASHVSGTYQARTIRGGFSVAPAAFVFQQSMSILPWNAFAQKMRVRQLLERTDRQTRMHALHAQFASARNLKSFPLFNLVVLVCVRATVDVRGPGTIYARIGRP